MAGSLPPTPGQTVGPFFHYGLVYPGSDDLVSANAPRSVLLTGRVLDGAGSPVPDAIVEIWQADENGVVPRAPGSIHRDGHTFTGFGRSATDADGVYQFWTVTPGSGRAGAAPFIAAAIFARGLPNKLHTRIYLPDDPALLADDPFIAGLGEAERDTLVAIRQPDGSLRHDIRLQGERETVFIVYER
jgi:protocatechuate 3,4-dioxygenase alpha subunit